MTFQSPEDRQFYEARLNYLRSYLNDEESRLVAAREKGREEGLKEAREKITARWVLCGRIQMMEEILGESVTSTGELLEHQPDELSKLHSELQQRLYSRGD